MTERQVPREEGVQCPTCGAASGSPCVVTQRSKLKQGEPAQFPHQPRFYAAVRAGIIPREGAGWIPREYFPASPAVEAMALAHQRFWVHTGKVRELVTRGNIAAARMLMEDAASDLDDIQRLLDEQEKADD